MERKQDVLKTKYFKIHKVTDLKDLLYQSATRYKNRNAFKLKNSNGKLYGVKYIKFKNDVEALGTSLIDLGLSNKSIAVIGKNSYSWITSYLASSIVGTVVPIDKELHFDDIINFINISEVKAVISDEKYLQDIIKNSNKFKSDIIFINMDNTNIDKKVLSFNNLISDGCFKVSNGDTSFKDIKINPDDMHILLFTSGTTGNAKGICLSHRNICSNIMSVAQIVKVDKHTVVLSILPVHHTYECTLGHLLPLFGGGTITYCDGLRYITQNISEYKPSFVICVPLLLENIHKRILKGLQKSLPKKFQKIIPKMLSSSNKHCMDYMPRILRFIVKKKIKKSLGGRIKTFIVGAAAINPSIIESFYKFGINALQGYGLTECSPLVAGNNDIFHKADSTGLPIPNVEYKINNPDDQGTGEIIVKGPNVMLGYFNDPEETDRVFKKGWFYTGDLGYIDDDGFLYITGRCKSVIVTQNGKNIFPEEIEYYLNSSPLVTECIVIGVTYNNDRETYVNAKILPSIDDIKEALNKKEISEEDINSEIKKLISEINKKLPNYKHIKNFKIVSEEFEKTTTRKIKRFGNNLSM